MKPITVYHFLSYMDDADGLSGHIARIAAGSRHRHVAMQAAGFHSVRGGSGRLRVLRLGRSAPDGNLGSLRAWLNCALLAFALRRRFSGRGHRVFVGHSRAGCVVALLLHLMGCRGRVWAQVQTLGRKRLLYRLMHRVLGARLIWLTPEMRAYYGVTGQGWENCIPPPAGTLPDAIQAVPLISDAGTIEMGGMGRLVEWKGWHVVVDAIDRLPPGVNLRFRHIGAQGAAADAAYAAALRVRAAPLEADGRVRFEGWTDDTHRFLREVTCLIVASTGSEGSSNAALEALRAGRRILVSDACLLLAPLLRQSGGGWLFPSRDSVALAALLERLASQPDHPARIDFRPLAAFDPRAVCERWDALFDAATIPQEPKLFPPEA